VRARGPRLSADLRVGGDAPLRLAARGRVDRGGGLVSVDALSLATPEVRWRQRGGPIRVDLGPRPALHGLALEAGRQRLAADVDVQRQRVTADVHVAHLELARLPALLVPERLRARATIDLDARVDVPLRWPVRDAGARTFAQVDLQVAGAQSLLPLVGLEQVRLTGPLRLRLSLDGTARRPVLSGRLSIEGLGIDGQPIGDVTLALNGEGEGPLDARLAVQPGAGGLAAGQLTATTRLSLSRLARRPPRGDEWLDLPFVVRGDVGRFPLGALARAFGREPLGGTVALRFSADGSARAPTGALSLDVSGATGPRLPPTDLRVDVSLGQRDTRVAARLSRSATAAGAGGQARVLAWLSAVVGLPGRRLTDASAIERAPLDVRLGVGPLDLQRLGAAAVAGDDAPSLRGHARLDAALTGTARAPVARATVDVRGVTLGAAPFGAAHAQLVYADGRAKVDADVSSANGGALHLSARATADLGYPAVARGLRVDQVPLRADLKADRFDLRWLSGWSRSVRRVGGTLDADVHLAGTAPAPRVTGRIDWRDGQLALTGMGDYDDIRLSAHGDQGALRLDRLTARSGGGTARASGRVERRDGEARLELDAHLSRFPVYGQGQVMARVSLDADAEGTASTEGLDASASIAEAHVELVDRSKKDLPALERPADFVLFRDGAPMNADERRKLRALLAARDPSAPQPALDDGRRAVRLAITAPRNLWLRGKDANLEIGLDPGFRVEVGERPRVFGRVVVRRGRVEALGRRFDVVAGSTATFTGPPDEPVLDVKARHTNTRENVTVLIALKGTLDDLDIAVSSPERPDLTETQLYTLIVTGRLGLGGGGPSAPLSSQAASLVGGLLAAQLQRVLSDKLPLDVLTLQTGDGMSGTRLEAGTYVSSDLYVGYVGRAGANPALLQNRNAVHLEYQISPRWSFNAEYGDVGTGTADLFWTKRY
jgi:translocation and assembly module TamB